MVKQLLVASLAVVFAACGGGKKGDTTPTSGPECTGDFCGNPIDDQPTTTGGPIVNSDTADQIQRRFERRGTAVSRCLAFVVDNKELPKNSHGKITLSVTISPSGRAEEVKVLKATLDSKSLNDCVIDRVKEIEFPELPKPYPTTYTYAFEAM